MVDQMKPSIGTTVSLPVCRDDFNNRLKICIYSFRQRIANAHRREYKLKNCRQFPWQLHLTCSRFAVNLSRDVLGFMSNEDYGAAFLLAMEIYAAYTNGVFNNILKVSSQL